MAGDGIWALATDEDMRKRRRAASDPMRMRILGVLGDSDGFTAKELAAKLKVDPNRLYYHLRILEDAGVVGVVDHRVVDRQAERVYNVVYRGRYIWDAEEPLDLAMNLGAILENTKADAEQALFEQARAIAAKETAPTITWGRPSFATTHEDSVEFVERVESLQQEFRARAKERADANSGVVPDGSTFMIFTWVVCEQPLDDEL